MITGGPSIKFHITNIHTMDELKMTGNCMKGSRPILSFDKAFDSVDHLKLVKHLFVDVFGTPRGHPKSKPFVDRVMSFHYADGKVRFLLSICLAAGCVNDFITTSVYLTFCEDIVLYETHSEVSLLFLCLKRKFVTNYDSLFLLRTLQTYRSGFEITKFLKKQPPTLKRLILKRS